ncbi:hypothetical protein [Pseudoduganella albidiflava]|uniref:Uncharacterized protein n=1 Tax=Pseudoduganella albidiflava TaxID=321983 RepID=A0A411WXW4_9BURK|nr:hypothetical protein [Pseudoduganella albidiflava]QBI01535.1 hypothetical protein EYF70_12250 [Pseudoduganella albidiflava]GGY34960.1 hypothetical protein GCM10007387_16160 [Pseudoduganella albidiflava]
MFLIGGLTLAVFVAGKIFPAVESTLWMAFLAFVTLLLYLDLREPVNYMSLDFDSNGFCYLGIGGRAKVEWSDICEVFYVRSFDDFASQIETQWQFVLKSGVVVMVMVEWSHKQSFASAIQNNLKIVSGHKVAEALRMRGEGRWRCLAD